MPQPKVSSQLLRWFAEWYFAVGSLLSEAARKEKYVKVLQSIEILSRTKQGTHEETVYNNVSQYFHLGGVSDGVVYSPVPETNTWL
jgi:hypothetical protein